MQILNARAALLSNFEVLDLLKEQEADHLARTRTALRVKKEESESTDLGSSSKSNIPPGGRDPTALPEITENMRTLQVEAISYLSADYQPTNSQTTESITRVTKGLQSWNLTKAEKLQVVNLAPRLPVELYVIVEELEDRFEEQPTFMDEVLELVTSNLDSSKAPTTNTTTASSPGAETGDSSIIVMEGTDDLQYPEESYQAEEEYDDAGEGAGVEGDLEMDEE